MRNDVIILGAGGHSKVLIDVLRLNRFDVFGIADPNLKSSKYCNVPIIGDDSEILKLSVERVILVNGIGSVKTTALRASAYQFFKKCGYSFLNIIHPSAIISNHVTMGEGVQVMAGAVIQPGCTIGNNTLVNTSASIDNDSLIGDHVHIAPGVTLSGGVEIGNNVHVGAGSVIIQGVKIGDNVTIGAGSVVLNDIVPGKTVFGVPAKAKGDI